MSSGIEECKMQQGQGTSMIDDHENIRKIPDFGKMRENFGTLVSKFPDHIKQSFSPPLTDDSGAIRPRWRKPA
jgi:hypothetical protein